MRKRIAAVGGVLLLLTSCASAGLTEYTQPGVSMEPTIKPGETIKARTVESGSYEPRHGDIVVFSPPASWSLRDGKLALKRVIAIGGETVATASGRVTVNGVALDEPYVKGGVTSAGDIASAVVPAGEIFVLGDNRTFSADSATHGPVPAANVTAVVE